MKQYLVIVEKEKSQFKHFSIQQVPHGDNEEADRLAKLASSTTEDLTLRILVEHLLEPSIKTGEKKEINTTSPEPEWASQIIRFFMNGKLPRDKEKARKEKAWTSQYLFIDDTFYKRSVTLPLLRCLTKEEANYVLREIHEEIYGSRSGAGQWPTKRSRLGTIDHLCKKRLSSLRNATTARVLRTFLRHPQRNWSRWQGPGALFSGEST